MLKDAFLAFLTQKLAPLRALNAIIFCIDEQCNLLFETALLTNCKIYIIFLFRWDPLSFLLLLLLLSLSLSLSLNISASTPMVDLWLTPNQPSTIIAAAQGEQIVVAHDEQWPHGHSCDLNQPTTTHWIWSHPRQFTVIWTHPWPPTAIWTPPTASHDNHQPTAI